MNVLGATERLARAGAQLALQEVTERLVDDVANAGEIALAHTTDVDFRKPSLGVGAEAIDRRPHAEAPARSSSRVITAE
jgi:hypothetical protein